MKATLMVLGFVGVSNAMAGVKSTVVNNVDRSVTVELNATSVICSHADYGADYLKVLIPDLADFTILNHRNEGAGAPCVAGGLCRAGKNMPGDILDANKPNELINVNVQLVRVESTDEVAKTCEVSMVERIRTTIRGIIFSHDRTKDIGFRNFDDCLRP